MSSKILGKKFVDPFLFSMLKGGHHLVECIHFGGFWHLQMVIHPILYFIKPFVTNWVSRRFGNCKFLPHTITDFCEKEPLLFWKIESLPKGRTQKSQDLLPSKVKHFREGGSFWWKAVIPSLIGAGKRNKNVYIRSTKHESSLCSSNTSEDFVK